MRWSLICFALTWFSHFPEWGEEHSHLVDEGSTDVSYSLESTGPDWSGLVVKSEYRKIKQKLETTRTTAGGRQRAVGSVGERHQISTQPILFKPGKTSFSNKLAKTSLQNWQNWQTGNNWFQWLYRPRAPPFDFSRDLPSASADNCSPLLKTASNSFGPLFFVLISSQTGNNSFLHLHSYSKSIYRW